MSSLPNPTAVAPLLFDRSDRVRMQFTGAKAAESLTGLVTNDVLALRAGDGQYACALTAKGRIIADLRIFAIPDSAGEIGAYLVDAGEAAGTGFVTMIRKYVNPRLAKYSVVTAETACLTVAGSDARRALEDAGVDASVLDALTAGPAYGHREAAIAGVSVRVACVPDLGAVPVFDIHLQRTEVPAVQTSLEAAGCVVAAPAEWRRLRALAARPEWGVDMDDTTLAQEANMDALDAISYKKGCYTGQETVARIHFRGHVNRTLRRVAFTDGVMPAVGTVLVTAEGAEVGDARSSAVSDAGTALGIAMLRREVSDAAELSWVDANGASHPVTVHGSADE